MRHYLLPTFVALFLFQPSARGQTPAFPLKVNDNQRFLVDRDGKPFFYLADTAWELIHRLNREDVDFYLQKRRDQGFTVFQTVILAEFDGLTVPNAYGHLPLENNDPTRPVEDYFKHVDYVVGKADEAGLVVALLPTWGDKWNKKWGVGPEIFTPENAQLYGEFLGKRYRDKKVLWILGGDRPIENETHAKILRAMAAGLRRGHGGNHLMSYHPMGGRSSSEWFQKDDWLSFNMLQSGHSRNSDNYRRISDDYAKTPTKPCLDGEPGYEDHPNAFKKENGYLDETDVRKAAYWAVFSGAFGHTYGCHDVWQFLQESRKPITFARTPWKKAIDFPGASQMRHLRKLMESRPILARVPDQSLLVDSLKGEDHLVATRGADYLFVYSPTGKAFTLNLGKISGKEVRASWFDPRTGKTSRIGTFANQGTRTFLPRSQGAGNDWVLILDDASRKS
jgi:hypothetical protein